MPNSSLYDNKPHKSSGVLFLYGVNMCYETFLPIFLRTALMRYNSHTVKFILEKCKFQWSSTYSQDCATTTTVQFQDIFITEKKKNPIGVILPFPFPPVLPQSTSSLHEFAYSRHFLQMESYNVFFCTEMFTAVLLIIVPKWKQLQMSIN